MASAIEFHEGQVVSQEAASIGWLALREVMRSWSIVSREGLTQWLRREGFQAVQPGNHIGARVQEALLGRACSEDARVALLESLCVALVLRTGREIRVEPALAATEAPPRDSVLGGWAQIGEVDLQEELLNRVPMLKSCPHFLRGRMRECFAVPSWRETFFAKPEYGNCSVWFRRCCCTDRATLAAWQGRVVAEVPTRPVGTTDPRSERVLVSFHQEHSRKKPLEGVWPPRAECRGGRYQAVRL